MLTCKQVSSLGSDYLELPLSWSLRLQINVHLLMCKHCRTYIRLLRTTIQQLASYSPEPPLTRDWYSSLDQKLGEKIADHDSILRGNSHTGPENRLQLKPIEHPRNETVRHVFKEITQAMGQVPNLFRVYAHNPDILVTNWSKVKSVMMSGQLSRPLKESIAVSVSADNDCRYCVTFHSRVLLSLGIPNEEIKRMLQEPLSVNFAPKEKALLLLARQANRDPHGASNKQIELARNTGASDLEIIEALAVMELYAAFNRFADTLDIPSDPPTMA